MSVYNTLTELIISRKNEEQKGITFILGDTEEIFVSYKALYYTSLNLLYDLQTAGYKPGDEVMFQIDDNQRFIYSFWACILGGMIPVPVTTGTNDEHKLKLFKIWDILNNPRIIATADFLEKLGVFAEKNDLAEQIGIIRKRATYVEESIRTENYGKVYAPQPDDIAFIQFSSGSTGDPKGVVITHNNVLINLHSVIRWAHIDSNDAGLNWMPLTHDMGLIGTHIKDVIACINQYNIQTSLFIRHPSLWIQKASEHKVTLLYSPNFGYKHFLKFFQPDIKKDWDLTNVRLIYNGAEPISMDLCNEFLDKMCEYGLKRTAMHPVYGLAEGTIAVTFPKPGEEFVSHTLNRNHLKIGETVTDMAKEDKNAITFIDVGYPIYNCNVRICDEENNDLGENKIGYIQIRGGNVTSGYYNNKTATGQVISPDGWLNTGDLGFMRSRRLTITGRAKDVIFIAGQNYYSHDIEHIAECVEGIEPGKIAVVGVFNERLKCDELVLFVMFRQKAESFIPTVLSLKRVINQKVGIEVSEVIPVKNIPKTTSGKVQRYRLRENYINGEYDLLKHEIHALMAEEFDRRIIEPPGNAIEKELVNIWSEILNNKYVGTRDNFFELGGDSLRITQLISRIWDTFGINLDHAVLFDNPEIVKLAAIIESSIQKRPGMPDKIEPLLEENSSMPLSFAQQRLWFIDRLNLNSPQYNLCTALLFKGCLDRDALNRSFNEIIKRHNVLQMSFKEENGQPVQVLNAQVGMSVNYMDLADYPEKEREKSALALAGEEARTPFDLEKAPLIRGLLLRTEEKEHVLILAAHHIVFDGWSFGVLLKELNFYYEEFLNNTGKCLSEPDIQYSDFARWQIEKVRNGSIKSQFEYWKKQLGGILPVLDLPADKQRPPIQTYNGAKLVSAVPGELVRELQAYARKQNATLFMVLLAAFKALLFRYSGQSDIIVGSTIANRNRREIEDLIGFFTNNIVLRTIFNEGTKFNELLRQVKRVTLEAYSNQDVPFEKLVEELHVERDMSRNPLFQVLFSLQNTPLPGLEFSEMDVSSIGIDSGYARFDLAVDICESGEGLMIEFEYNTDLFSDDTITRIAGHYKQLLDSIIKNPDKILEGLEILSREEKNTLIYKWNKTKEDYGDIKSWIQLFEKQADRTPDAVAVICGKHNLSYRELDERSNRLAHYLISNGVGSESIVGIYIDRSIEMLVGLLGIHKAEAAYLPMDPIFPADRLAYMLEDAHVNIILSETKLSGALPDCSAKIICLDAEWDIISDFSAEKPADRSNAHNLAYLIYTSGSTGKPKGVQIEQCSLINFLMSMVKKTELNERDALLAVTTLSFDIAGLELYLPLICGARVVIAERDDVTDGSRLAEMLQEHGIGIMQATPATWKLLIDSGWTGSSRLKILCGGEALPGDLANQLLDRCSMLFNVYGPTETTIWSTISRVESGAGSISIGKPIANTQIYVLDKSMNPVPIGLPGELFIGGDGLARGYLNLPELTGEKFISDPFSKKEHARLYKTGDLVKYLPDGRLEFMGRMDNQVKVRGFRIELGEIETLLNQNIAVKESVVAAKEMIQGEKSLIAYIIPSQEKEHELLSVEYLRKSLNSRLPDYMIPAAFIIMDSYPMTPNGKIDKKALPLPEGLRPQLGTNYKAPSNGTENAISSIWQEILKMDGVGVNDNFFDLGGHSLLLAQVRSKIEKVLNKEVSMMDLFKYPTISTLSRFISGEGGYQAVGDPIRKPTGKAGNADIAVIGMSGRFPGAMNIKEFWRNLCDGVESISYFTDGQVIKEGVAPEVLKKPGYVKAWGALEDIDRFDALFFGYSPREAEVLDPQQRIFLEESWKALENAGYDSEKFDGLIGVYASVGMNTYAQNLKESHSSMGLANDYQIMISNDKDFLATRIAYKLNLEGPGITVQTACSSSLVAVHLACQSLVNGECDMALAGGVSIRLPQKSGYLYQEGMILSPDGHCRAFDKDAKGTVGGNGAGLVVLKRLEDAAADRDNIYAVIKGSAINNDGALKIGYTAPRIDGQARVIAEAQAKADIEPETITYIEAHGTGTPLGDPIEIEALTRVFNKKTDKKGFCAVGSVKSNIGHTDASAGVTGLIKAVLSLYNKKIPPSLNFNSPNPEINFKDSPFFVNKFLFDWKRNSGPLRAGVSSFGIGGTNAHVILEEAPAFSSDSTADLPCLLVLSAKSRKALDRMTAQFIDFLKENRGLNLADIAYTLHLGRREFEYRRFLISTSVEDSLEALENADKQPERVFSSSEGQIASNPQLLIEDIEPYTLEQLGHKWLEGAKIIWGKLYKGQKRNRTALPAYPFEGQVYWAGRSSKTEALKPAGKKTGKAGVSEWFYTPVWKQSVEENGYYEADENREEVLLVLKDENGFTDALVRQLKKAGQDVTVAVSGHGYKMINDSSYTINADDPSHYDNLLKDISGAGKKPSRIVNLLGVTGINNSTTIKDCLDCGERLFYSMLYLAQATGRQAWTHQIKVKIVTDNSQRIFNEKVLYPEKALNLGACRVIPREYPNIKCSNIDLVLSEPGSMEEQETVEQLTSEISAQSDEVIVAFRGMGRWKQEFESIKLHDGKNPAIKLKNKGVYLITGGLGGIGLVLAEYMAREAQAKLVLAGRSGFPEMERWDDWTASHNKRDVTSGKITKLRQCQAFGADLLICRCDVSDVNQLKNLQETIWNRYGRLDGLIHAAGNPGGGMVQLKKKENASQVLAPKVKGTLALYEAFKDYKLDFMIFCSSLNAITGGFGQMDYSAANAFLDAFAQARDSIRGTRVISIDWDRWPGVGMASGTGQGMEIQLEDVHPLLGRCMSDNTERVIYSGERYPEKDWVLSEHYVLGIPTIAGTTYLEMARAAFEDITGNNKAEISEVIFLSPMAVKPGEKRNVYTIMNKNSNHFDFSVISKIEGEEEDKIVWLEHVRGKIAPLDVNSEEIININIQELKERCNVKTVFSSDDHQELSEEFISFGPRWRSLKKFLLGKGEGLVEAEIPKDYASDLEVFKLHPALLDVSTGAVRLAAGGNYLPFSYERLEINGWLPEKIYGHIRFKNGYSSLQEVITCDIDILDENGTLLTGIKNFSMRLTGEAAATSIKSRSSTGLQKNEYAFLVKRLDTALSNLPGILDEGLTSTKGQEAFGHILKGCFRPQVVVSTKDIYEAIKQADYINLPEIKNTFDEAAVSKERHPRPELEVEYVLPGNETEKKLAELWQSTLSIENVGIYDEFFALGGDSLSLIQLHTKLKEMFQTDIAVVDLYKYNTIASLSKYLCSDNSTVEQPAFEGVNSRVNKQLEIIKQRKQQMQRRKGVVAGE